MVAKGRPQRTSSQMSVFYIGLASMLTKPGRYFGAASQVEVQAVFVDRFVQSDAAFSASNSATSLGQSEGNKNLGNVDEANSTSARELALPGSWLPGGVNCSKKVRRQIQQVSNVFVPGEDADALPSAIR